MPTVEPHLYRDTPIFREMLYEREGRYPGTPEGEEPIEIELSPQEPAQAPLVHMPEPTEPDMSTTLMSRLVKVQPLAAVVSAVPMPPEIGTFKVGEDVKVRILDDPERTQSMPIPLMVDPDDE